MKIDLRQNTLFGSKVISSINFDEQEMIRDILHLHANGKYIDCDPTYSVGNFYKDGLPEPKFKFDKTPQAKGVVQATSDNLPIEDASCETIMFDPPFVMGASEAEGASQFGGLIGTRFTAFKDFDELKEMYSGSLKEFARVLIGGGYSNIQMSGLRKQSKKSLYTLLGYE